MNTKAQGGLFAKPERTSGKPVECLGTTFESDEARRAFYLERLREKLQDSAFRSTPGFPHGSDEEILRMSDPPYYTACPNPFLSDFVRTYGRRYDHDDSYECEPFAVDVSEGKYDWLYRAHAYHTKVPHLAIVPSILHYTRPGDLVLDGFCGSGMTGLAAQWCGSAPLEYRRETEAEWRAAGRSAPEWGARRVILNDLGPAATFIAAGYNLPFDYDRFTEEAHRIVSEVERELGWMYSTTHADASTSGTINFMVWSEVFSCPECGGDVNFLEEAVDEDSKAVTKTITCPHCGAESKKEQMALQFVTRYDERRREARRSPRRVPALIEYTANGSVYTKQPDESDLACLQRIAAMPLPQALPEAAFPDCQMTRVGRMKTTEVQHVDDLFLARSAHILAALWVRAQAVEDVPTRHMLLFSIEQIISTGSILNRYRPNSSFGNGPLRGVYYVASQVAEASPFMLMDGILRRMERGFGGGTIASPSLAIVSTGDCGSLDLPDNSVDYVFTDPPFGENIYYSDLNFLVEAWHGVVTSVANEAIVDRVRDKGVAEYQALMRTSFAEYYRVLKPGRWMTVVFSNSKNAIWRAIQESMGTSGFVVADVRTLDKKHGSFRQVTSSAVKQDLIISAYKPTESLTQRFTLGTAGAEAAWAFIAEHLGNVTQSPGEGDRAAVIAERTPQMLLDRMIAFFVQRGVAVPISGPEFLTGLAQRFPERDGMYFLPEQVAAYDRQRTKVAELKQLDLFVTDEASAIQWVRQQLHTKPQKLQDLTPTFIREVQAWAKHEETVELRTILEQNFLRYDGTGPVPSQIHAYLSNAYREMRGLDKTDPALVEKARDRWYVPDPNKQAEREKIRERELLKEFEEYRASRKKLKQFRTEAVRAGFKAAYDRQDYRTIVDVAERLPESVLQEDEKLLMYYDVAAMRLGD